MLLFFIFFIFFILHIQFLLRNIFFGLDELNYFQFVIKYGFDRGIAIQSLLFSLACMFSFSVCYKLFYRKRRKLSVDTKGDVNSIVSRRELFSLNIMGIMMIAYILVVIGLANFDYSVMTQIREANGFIFELRMIFLLLISHILLNVPWRNLLRLRELKTARWVVLVYIICTLLFQARSATFEVVSIIAFSQLVWAGDKVKIKYIVIVMGMLLVPNLIVLGRLGIPEEPGEFINGIFSFEYSILINNFLSAAILSGSDMLGDISFIPSLQLLIPSPLRDLFGIAVVKSSFYADLSDEANVSGGSFSLLAEMFSNFGWFSLVIFGLLGAFIGYWNSRAARVGFVSILYSSAPLLYAALVLAFRNDFGIFLKYSIQVLIVSWILTHLFSKIISVSRKL